MNIQLKPRRLGHRPAPMMKPRNASVGVLACNRQNGRTLGRSRPRNHPYTHTIAYPPEQVWPSAAGTLLLRVSALYMGSAVSQMDNAREAQLSMHALCCSAHFSGLLSLWRSVMDRRRVAAVALEVSLWACGRTVRRQTSSTISPSEPYIGAELGPLLAEACAGGTIKGPEQLWGARHCHIGSGG